MPRDATRETKVDFGPAYYFIASTYLVPAGSPTQSIDEVNRPGVRIVGISNTTTVRSARRTAPNASVQEVPSVELMTEMARNRQGDAFALSHDSFVGLLPKLPGARVLAGHFQQTGIAVAVPKGRGDALALASGCSSAKKSGTVRRALDAAGQGRRSGATRGLIDVIALRPAREIHQERNAPFYDASGKLHTFGGKQPDRR